MFIETLAAFAQTAGSDGGAVIELPPEEARHAVGSRRLSAGDAIRVFDGFGHSAVGEIVSASKPSVKVRIGEVIFTPRPVPALTLAVAMPKGSRQDDLIARCTELGTAAIMPLATERSVAGVSDHKRDRWRRTTIEAAKQSGQCWLPELAEPATLPQVLTDAPRYDLVLAAMLPQDGDAAGIQGILERVRGAEKLLATIGPEGGWSPAEAQALLAAGAVPVSLGPNVLRIETAATALASFVHACLR